VTFKPCAIVPSRNHHRVVPGIVQRLRASALPVFIIDDGSTSPTREALALLHAPESGVTVRRLEINQGKGGAVIAGFELAAAAGFTHALQIDADGQHDLSVLPQMLADGEAYPQAVVVGAPVFDATIPFARWIGRWLTHLCVCVETLSLRILDTMCGFRLYPLAPVMALLRRERLGRRMDFDTEILVHLIWCGIQPVPVPVLVTYPPGNTSNFDVLRDNWAMTRMHARLIFKMLAGLPGILRARRQGAELPHHWAELRERGAYWGLCVLTSIYRVLGWYGCMALALPVTLYFHVTGVEQRRASRLFLSRAFAMGDGTRRPSVLDGIRHTLDFTRKAVETFAAWVGDVDPGRVEIVTPNELDKAMASRRGLILIVSHLGNAELSRAALGPELQTRIAVLAHTRHAENYARIVERFRPEAAVNMLQVTDMNPGSIATLQDMIEEGRWIAIAGDRTPVHGENRISRAVFLGYEAEFPQGPYVLAHILDCPVYLMFCLRERGRYRLYFERFAERIDLPRKERQKALDRWVGRYAARLEEHCLKDPLQWHNFFDFWATAATPQKAAT